MEVTRLFVHPVKSLGGIGVNEFAIDRFGPVWDRRWLVVDRQGQFITQRQQARMALVRAVLENGRVTLNAPQREPLTFSATDFADGDPVKVQVWRDQCDAVTGPAHFDQWLSDFLDVDCRLVFMPESSRRPVNTDYAKAGETVGFADGFPLLLAAEESLSDLNSRMSIAIGMERFRPNLVVAGSAAFAEDGWKRIRVGTMEFRVAKPCSRCAIPTIDPATAQKQPEVFKTLKAFRQRDGEVYFGQNLLPVGAGSVRVGDRVVILE
jgi:uncharacterized protein YcbX